MASHQLGLTVSTETTTFSEHPRSPPPPSPRTRFRAQRLSDPLPTAALWQTAAPSPSNLTAVVTSVAPDPDPGPSVFPPAPYRRPLANRSAQPSPSSASTTTYAAATSITFSPVPG